MATAQTQTQDPLDAVTQLLMKQQGGQYGTSTSSGGGLTGIFGGTPNPPTNPNGVPQSLYPTPAGPNTGSVGGGTFTPPTNPSNGADVYGNAVSPNGIVTDPNGVSQMTGGTFGITDPGQGPNKATNGPQTTFIGADGKLHYTNDMGVDLGLADPTANSPFPQQANKAAASAAAGQDTSAGGALAGMQPRQQFQAAVQALGLTPAQARGHLSQVVDYINSHGGTGWTADDAKAGDWVSVNGQGFDVLPAGDANWQWLVDNGGSGSGGAGGAFGPQVGGIGQGGPADSVFNLLMRRAQQNVNVGPNDPIIKGQTDAYDATQQRSRRNYLQNIAEQAGPGANTTAEARQSASTVGSNDAAYQAGLMGTERTALRQQAQAALSGAYGFLTSEQQLQLTQLLHNLDLQQGSYEFDTNQAYLNSPAAHPTA